MNRAPPVVCFNATLICAALALGAGCTALLDFDRGGDAGPDAATVLDAGMDAGARDASASDAGPVDGGVLDAESPDGGPPDAESPDGGAPDAGCGDCGSCCVDGTCVSETSASQCGSGGEACVSCGATADRCGVDGACVCGFGPACSEGQRCSGGACVCNGDSCPDGCCDGSQQCRSRDVATCGVRGAACIACGAGADRCDAAGTCACGAESACGPALVCPLGACVCSLPTTMSEVDIEGTVTPRTRYAGTPIQVRPGETLTLSGVASVQTNCPSCVIQVALAVAGEGYGYDTFGCYSAGVPGACNGVLRSSGPQTFQAPETPGVYPIRVGLGGFFNHQCDLVLDFFNNYPDYGLEAVAEIEVVSSVPGRCDVLDAATVRLNGVDDEVTVAPGTTVNLDVDWTYISSTSGTVISQIVFGVVGPDDFVLPLACPFSRTFGGVCVEFSGAGTTGSFVAPTTPGRYEIRWQNWAEFTCADALGRFVAPGATRRQRTIGIVNVAP
ncbi:MAG: hypothetical protein AB8I08_01925 [Sandaracinaceae bacterium]